MRLHRFYISKNEVAEFAKGKQISLTNTELIHQAKDVFRFKIGQECIVFNGSGLEVLTKIEELSKKVLTLQILEVQAGLEQNTQNKLKVTLAFALLKGEHTEFVLEKCTELGVVNFQPLTTDRTIKTGFRRERLEKIITEATEQSVWSKIPELSEPVSLEEFLKESVYDEKDILVMDMDGEKLPLPTSYYKEGKLILLIGPEGGWSERERELFKKLNLKTFSLGPQTLRAETACVASVAKIM
jgi:16S rRNA (uracil1498-N3)-methyltransferase